MLAIVKRLNDPNLATLDHRHGGGHVAKLFRAVGLPLVALPPYAPELNSAEWVFEKIHRAVEGFVCADVDAKVAAVEALLADPARVRRLVGWDRIADALARLLT